MSGLPWQVINSPPYVLAGSDRTGKILAPACESLKEFSTYKNPLFLQQGKGDDSLNIYLRYRSDIKPRCIAIKIFAAVIGNQ